MIGLQQDFFARIVYVLCVFERRRCVFFSGRIRNVLKTTSKWFGFRVEALLTVDDDDYTE